MIESLIGLSKPPFNKEGKPRRAVDVAPLRPVKHLTPTVGRPCGHEIQSINSKMTLSVLSFLVALSGLGCSSRFETTADRVGDQRGSITWDGLKRTYLSHIPPSWNSTTRMPLVIVLHGAGGTGEGMVKLTRGRFNALADREGFVVVYPDGTRFSDSPKTRWNDGRDERYSQGDDVGFLSALIAHLGQTLNIDQRRVYATGISNGAHMSLRLARELSDKIAAVAVVAYAMQEKYASIPVSTRPISVLVMTGTKDPLVPWQGGQTPYSTGERMLGKVLSLPETVKVLVAHNQCPTTPTVAWEPNRDPEDRTLVKREHYANCKEGSEVVLFAIEGGGHTWPGGWQYLPERWVGKTSRDVDASEVIWNFFKKHAKKAAK